MQRLLVAIGTVLLSCVSHAQTYHVVAIGAPEGFTESQAFGLNDAGVVAGAAFPNSRAFTWTAGGGFVLLDFLLGGTESAAFDVNDAGVVVGESNVVFVTGKHAVRWTAPGVPEALEPSGAQLDRVRAINGAGVMVGSAATSGFPSGSSALARWNADGEFEDVSPAGASNVGATDINDAGQIVAIGSPGFLEPNFSFVYDGEDGYADLVGLPDDDHVLANAINEAGVVVGASGTFLEGGHATAWAAPDAPQDLGVLDGETQSEAFGVNDAGVVVGSSGSRAFVWTEADGMRDLNEISDDAEEAELHLESARAVNASGQILGLGFLGSTSTAWLATPVPEAGAAWPACCALALLRRRRAQGAAVK